MPQPLEYETPAEPLIGPWHARVPLLVLFLLIIAPSVLFGRGGRIIPGEKWRWHELVLPAAGCPIALAFAALSFRGSSPRRRLGLLVVCAFAVLVIVSAAVRSMSHW